MSFIFGMLLLRIDVALGKIHENVGVVSGTIVHNYFDFQISEEQSFSYRYIQARMEWLFF